MQLCFISSFLPHCFLSFPQIFPLKTFKEFKTFYEFFDSFMECILINFTKLLHLTSPRSTSASYHPNFIPLKYLFNPSSTSICIAHIFIGMGPPTGVWPTYQEPFLKNTLYSTTRRHQLSRVHQLGLDAPELLPLLCQHVYWLGLVQIPQVV